MSEKFPMNHYHYQVQFMESIRFLKMTDGGHYFVIKVNDGEAILTSQRYKTSSSMSRGLRRVSEYRKTLSCYQIQNDSADVFYFVLKGRSGRILGTSEMYKSKERAEKGVNAFMHWEEPRVRAKYIRRD